MFGNICLWQAFNVELNVTGGLSWFSHFFFQHSRSASSEPGDGKSSLKKSKEDGSRAGSTGGIRSSAVAALSCSRVNLSLTLFRRVPIYQYLVQLQTGWSQDQGPLCGP